LDELPPGSEVATGKRQHELGTAAADIADPEVGRRLSLYPSPAAVTDQHARGLITQVMSGHSAEAQ